MKKWLTVVGAVFFPALCVAQPISTLLRNAERAAEAGLHLEAAELWERAGRLKDSDPALLYQAAEAFAQVRDYHRAADCYRVASTDTRFPLAPLRYARALKQQGRYEEAVQAFDVFATNYRGAHKAVMTAVTENEIAGCQLALTNKENTDTLRVIGLLGDVLNSPENEFAPIPFSDDLLYFSRTAGRRAQLLRSVRKNHEWAAAVEAVLPEAVSARFGSGSFTTDGQRFYYTQCEDACPAMNGGSAAPVPCAIYCLRRSEEGWMPPERLPAYINMEGSTALHPQVARVGGIEYLFFASNRTGSLGGLDLFVSERPADSEGLDFSFPQNLGRRINTGADEVTPFYETSTETLWFSSLGHPSLGGMDVFSAQREGNDWLPVQNAGILINSAADDYFFTPWKNGEGAYFSSNRRRSAAEPTTTDDNIWHIKW
ncbi:MAG: hypothetical protein SFV22_17910 [Saprospiraceae bacterium]|nr:hypothetical protein [Saprospiraceae bacterium]